MIKLKTPLLWDGHMIQAGIVIQLTTELEKSMVLAGNGEYLDTAEQNKVEIAMHPDIPDLAKRIEALKLELPDGLTYEQVLEAVEKAEQEQKSTPPATIEASDPELNLGRVGGGTQ